MIDRQFVEQRQETTSTARVPGSYPERIGSDAATSLPGTPRDGIGGLCRKQYSPARLNHFALHGDSDDEMDRFELNCDSDEDLDVNRSGGLEDMFVFETIGTELDGELLEKSVIHDLEDMYSFDIAMVADALRRGVGLDELSEVIEDGMASTLERGLAGDVDELPIVESASGTVTPDTLGDDFPYGLHCTLARDLSGRMTPGRATPGKATPTVLPALGGATEFVADELSGRMTPPWDDELAGRMTPPDGGQSLTVSPAFVSSLSMRLRQSLSSVQTKRRRSSVAQHPELVHAVRSAHARHRQSMAAEVALAHGRQGLPHSADRMQQAVASACRVHRKSVLQAAEVLEVAGIGVNEKSSEVISLEENAAQMAEVDEQLHLVQEAVNAARRRHRTSIAEAMNKVASVVQGSPSRKVAEKSSAKLSMKNLPEDRVQRIVAAAYDRYNERRKATGASKESRGPPAPGAPLALMHTDATPRKRGFCSPATLGRSRRAALGSA